MANEDGGLLTYRGAVYPTHCDHIGHMNVASYVSKFDEASWSLFCALGLTPSYLRADRFGMAAVQQNIAYRLELFAGRRGGGALARAGDRRQAHPLRAHDVLTSSAARSPRPREITAVHLDKIAHKACPFPAAVREKAQALLDERGLKDYMAPAVLAIVAATILVTSFISGIFGMAGGIILLGVLLIFLDVAPAMMLFGTIQMASNGWRAALWLRYVDWGIVWRYLVGSTLMFLALRSVAIIPSKAVIYLGLGLIPFAADFLPKRLTPDITRPGAPYICGAFIILLQLLAGAAGHILDVFFQKSRMDRKSIVATKAVTQVTGHLYRIIYFGSFTATFDDSIPLWAYAVAIGLAFAGTSTAALVLHRMTDEGFRMWSRRVTISVSVTYLARGLWLVAAPP